ncbi:MAG TPA: ribonuclease P protein component [Ktedonobacteraceae bacterium]|nr:ribonuclease P protein component [Ktedonobacteraceae bacterium]
MALNRALRLRKGSEFQRVRQQGRSLASRLLILAWASCPADRYPNAAGRPRIGFIVSKRVSKLAVERNYIKRLLGEAIRPSLPGLPAGTDIVISARNLAKTADLPALEEDVVNLLQRAGLLERHINPDGDTQ